MNMLLKVLTVIGMTLVATVMCSNYSGASTLEEIAQSTYKLYSYDKPHCSIVAISPTQFVTANHCVKDMKEFNVRSEVLNDKFELLSSDVRYLNVVRTIEKKDVAFLQLRGPSRPNEVYVDIAPPDTKLKPGDQIIHAGYPAVQDFTITEGLFTALVKSPFDGEDPVWKVTTPVAGGSSGGGFYTRVHKNGQVGNPAGLGLGSYAGDWQLVGTAIGMNTRNSFMTYISTPKAIDEVTKSLIKLDPVKKEEVEAPKTEEKGKNPLINPSDEK